MWDALFGDSAPVYLGQTGINKFIPPERYVDAGQFKDAKQMLDWLHNTPEMTWTKYRTAERQFIHSAAVDKYLPEAFAEEFVGRVVEITRGRQLVSWPNATARVGCDLA